MVNHLALIDFPDVECRISSLGAYSMERTSSLDLFRGSADGSFFSDLNFLEELPAEAEPVSHSQPLPASLPLQHTAGSQRPAVSAQHSSSSLSTTPAFGVAWPQTIGRLPSRVYSRPVNFPDTFLHPSTHPINHTRHSDSQPDSSIALLNDDTALGFADDCFRRESDLFLSQDRVSQHDAHAVNHVAAADGVNGPSMIQLQGYNLTADSTQQQSVHATSFRPSLAATGSETIKPAPSANKLDTQAPATTPAEHDAAAIDQGPLEVPEQATPQDSSKTQAAQTTEANHQPPVIQPGVHGNDDDHSSAALNLPGHTEAVVGPVTKVAADADEPTVACPVTEQSSPVLPALSQASAAPTADSSKVNQLLVHQEQAVQLGQASKLKLAVQDYQPHNAQAPRGDNAEALGKLHLQNLRHMCDSTTSSVAYLIRRHLLPAIKPHCTECMPSVHVI